MELIADTEEARDLATSMYVQGLEMDEAKGPIQSIFMSGGVKPPIGGFTIRLLRTELRERFSTGKHESVEARYASFGSAIVHEIARRNASEYNGLYRHDAVEER